MASLANQNISTSYPQVLKTFGANSVGSTLAAIASGDEAGVSALQISTTGVKSTGTFAVDGAATFGSSITASTGTATIGTISVNTATIGTLSTLNGISVTTTATLGTAKIGATGSNITKVSYGTAAFSASTAAAYNSAGTCTGTFTLTGAAIGDIASGSINTLGSATGGTGALVNFYVVGSDTVRYAITNPTTNAIVIPAGVIHAVAWRFV
jgi:hypothetical protein